MFAKEHDFKQISAFRQNAAEQEEKLKKEH